MILEPGTFRVPPTDLPVEQLLILFDALNREACRKNTFHRLRWRFGHLIGEDGFFPVFSTSLARPLVRGRLIKRGPGVMADSPRQLLNDASELGAPHARHIKEYGRCQPPGISIFYGAFNEDTVLAELAPEPEDLVYITTYQPSSAQIVGAYIGLIDEVRRFGRSRIFERNPIVPQIDEWVKRVSTDSDYVRLATDAFLAEVISRPVEDASEYKAGAALSSLILAMTVNGQSHGVAEMLIYPSVAHQGGINVAILPTKAKEILTPTSCRAVGIVRSLGNGIYQTRLLAETRAIEDGRLLWQ